jgi:hypothetical protein
MLFSGVGEIKAHLFMFLNVVLNRPTFCRILGFYGYVNTDGVLLGCCAV